MSAVPLLSLLEVRVLGALVEKQRTVPDTYPLTLNALLSACNQKTSRDPVMSATDMEVQAALDGLRRASLIIETSGGRASRFAHNAERVLQVPAQSVALLATLMLRGPQTVAELRLNCERLHRFADISTVEAFLHELAERPAGALVVELPRQAGSRENRWAHLLSGVPKFEASSFGGATPLADLEIGASELATLKEKVAYLEDDVAALKATVAKLCAELGVGT